MRKYLSLLLAALSVACAKETQREAVVVFSPAGEADVTSGQFGIEFPAWKEGE